VPGSVNVNEPYYDGDDDSPEPDLRNVDESGEFAFPTSLFTSADPHRTLSWNDPKRIVSAVHHHSAPASEGAADRVREPIRNPQEPGGPKTASQGNLGPCLYFGPAGQRCDRRASAGGFCARHQPNDADRFAEMRSASLPQISKRALGAAGIIAVLWPILFDLIRELLRFLR
jgi:hypothetical protein